MPGQHARGLGLSPGGLTAAARGGGSGARRCAAAAADLLLLLGRHRALQAEGVEEVERHGVRHHTLSLQRREEARLPPSHVVLLAALVERVGALPDTLEEEDEAEDLQLTLEGDGIPLRARAADGRDVRKRDLRRQLPRPVQAVRLHHEADEGGHRNAAVLDLRLAQEADGGGVVLVPEARAEAERQVVAAQTQRVPVAHDRVLARTHAEIKRASAADPPLLRVERG